MNSRMKIQKKMKNNMNQSYNNNYKNLLVLKKSQLILIIFVQISFKKMMTTKVTSIFQKNFRNIICRNIAEIIQFFLIIKNL